MPRYAEMIYNGFWFAPEREMLQSAIDKSQQTVTGTVRMKLFKGMATVVAAKPHKASTAKNTRPLRPIRSTTSATPKGFIKLNALRLRIGALSKKL